MDGTTKDHTECSNLDLEGHTPHLLSSVFLNSSLQMGAKNLKSLQKPGRWSLSECEGAEEGMWNKGCSFIEISSRQNSPVNNTRNKMK